MDPIATQIADTIKTRLEAIRTANGYRTEAGQDVAPGWRYLNRDDPTPHLTFSETGHEVLSSAKRGGNARVQLEWTIEGSAEMGASALKTLYAIEDDIKRAIFTPNPDLTGLVRAVTYAGRTVAGPEDGSRLVSVQVRVLTEHAEQLP
ncbi:hypothetical protein [Methylohalobius crimeensis]|uniref:hypothetical protein n=1 Tax=Methylohalobius crimeensis TaxID=244365 RepID=UPI0003B2EB1C|nr:hypothetical protein [Methylohalobius crimeensis]